MTCRDLMTENPSCCVPGDSVATAAQIMKREDVGPVLVVSDHAGKRLVGIVTDRDLALKVVAEGRDPHSTRIDEVMSSNPVTCRDDSDAGEAVRLMADHQVRRIPIVDQSQRLVGIVAQADVARYADEGQVGEMVEEISQPYGQGEWSGQLKAGGGSGMSVFAAGAIGMGLGVGLMYLLDPSGGERRRTRLRQTTTDLFNTSSQAVQRTGAELKEKVSSVRSRYGRGEQEGESYPTSANVSATDAESYM